MTAPAPHTLQNSAELQADRAGDVLHLHMQRPDKGNALSADLVAALHRWTEHAAGTGVRLLVVEGAGRHFCTGFDLSALDAETDDSLLARFTRVELMLQAIDNAPFPTLAVAHGRTMGAGADLFCACTHRWIVDDASFAFPGAAFGLVLGTSRLAETVGEPTARHWIESGRSFAAEEALASGLATRRVSAAELPQALQHLAAQSSRLATATQSAIHAALGAARRPRAEAGAAQDLARLVRSAAEPGLKDRIAAYRAAQLASTTITATAR